ncbi:ABC transporter ATP-binding protein [Streptomyces sp. NPDC006798]|uniref:ABC transporter ATP-binding protein n=1 Tax=Streptomyces sp. NPDC006798 TaxID=3155462 RepID=UPI0033F4E896
MIELTEVTKVYPGGVTALAGVSLRIGRGELVGIVGPSGSGKSTMLHVLGTLDRPSTGRVRIDGYDVGALSDRRLSALRAGRIGFVFQHFHLAAGTTALENVADGLLYSGLRPAERRRRAASALERVGLGHRTDHEPHELSGGEKQRVAIARAVAGDPPLLLADEPTGALDSVSGDGVMRLLRELNRAGTTVLVITHDREIAASLPRQVLLRDGLMVADTRTDDPVPGDPVPGSPVPGDPVPGGPERGGRGAGGAEPNGPYDPVRRLDPDGRGDTTGAYR